MGGLLFIRERVKGTKFDTGRVIEVWDRLEASGCGICEMRSFRGRRYQEKNDKEKDSGVHSFGAVG